MSSASSVRPAVTDFRVCRTSRTRRTSQSIHASRSAGTRVEYGGSPAALSHQFGNKTDLLLAILDLATEVAETRFYESLPQDGAGMNPTDVSALWDAYLSLVDRRADVVTIQLRETHSPHPEIAEAIRRLTSVRVQVLGARYRKIARQGVSVDAEAMADMAAALAVGALTTYLHTDESDRARRKAELVDRLTTMTLSGISGFITDPGPSEAPDSVRS